MIGPRPGDIVTAAQRMPRFRNSRNRMEEFW